MCARRRRGSLCHTLCTLDQFRRDWLLISTPVTMSTHCTAGYCPHGAANFGALYRTASVTMPVVRIFFQIFKYSNLQTAADRACCLLGSSDCSSLALLLYPTSNWYAHTVVSWPISCKRPLPRSQPPPVLDAYTDILHKSVMNVDHHQQNQQEEQKSRAAEHLSLKVQQQQQQ